MATKTRHETHTLQLWPNGTGYEYTGDPNGPRTQKRLRHTRSDGTRNRWRFGTADEWRQIRINERARMYLNQYVYQNVCGLVSDLIQAASSGDLRGELGEGFTYENIRNLHADPSEWDAAQCRAWLSEHGYDDQIDCRYADRAECDAANDGDDDTCLSHHDGDDVTDQLRELVRARAPEHEAEVYEWYLVDAWLCRQLHEIGEVTIDNGYGEFWGRTCTGQAVIMDGTLQEIAAKFERGEG